MNRIRLRFLCCRRLCAVLPLLLAACASSPPVRHYLLEATAVGELSTERARRTLTLRIEHVQLADYLNRLPIVRRAGDGRLVFNDGERWAEPLELAFRRVLADNLDRLLGGNTVVPSPTPAATDSAYRLRVEVSQFDIGADRQAVLDARWSLRPANGKDGIVHHSRLLRPLTGSSQSDSAATVDALNRLLTDFALEVKTAVLHPDQVCSTPADCR